MPETLKVALVGNPNSGKTSLFNALTGLRQKVGNFPGITVEKKTGRTILAPWIEADITDLPGSYSLFPKSTDEAIPLQVLMDPSHHNFPDRVLYIADASNLKRNMMLMTQVLDLKLPTVVALNMIDQVKKQGQEIDLAALEDQLGVPVVAINARKRENIDELKQRLLNDARPSTKNFAKYSEDTTAMLEELRDKTNFPSLYHGFVHTHIADEYNVLANGQQGQVNSVKESYKLDYGTNRREDVLARYRSIDKILLSSYKNISPLNKNILTAKLDKVLMHRVWGYVIFLFVLFLIFQAIYSWAALPMEWIENGFAWLGETISAAMPAGILNDLVVNGILAGLSGVVVFIPQIAILYVFIAIMEDTGYLARVSFLMDKLMRKFGMSGKSVLPLMSGTACAVPAIMATRNIENWKDRLITILVTPLMSCAARLPVYILLIGLVVPDRTYFGLINLQGLNLMAMYLLGFVAALLAGLVFRYVIKMKGRSYFMLELPVYRLPRVGNLAFTAYDKSRSFVVEAGKIIIAISIILWVLASFGPADTMSAVDERYADAPQTEETEQLIQSEKLKESYAGIVGRTIEPVIRPLGFDWKIGIALLTSFAAREVFVGTIATLYGLEGEGADFGLIKERMLAEMNPHTNRPVYTPATVFSLMIFFAFAMQCMSTLAITYKETAQWKYPVAQFFFLTGLAYVCSLIVYQVLA